MLVRANREDSDVKGAACAAALLFACVSPANGQTKGQLWGTATFNWLRSDRLTFELEVEPKVLLEAPEGEPGWASLDATPNVEYALRAWLDLVGEVATGYTAQTDDVFANRQRVRAGFGYRRNLNWRFEALYIWTRSRDATDEDFKTSDNILNLRVKRVF
jgi:hypothetical protein